MRRAELVKRVVELGIPRKRAVIAVAVFLDAVEEGLKTADKVAIRKCGASGPGGIIAERSAGI